MDSAISERIRDAIQGEGVMAGESDIAYDFTTSGWTCGLCSVFVKPGAYHDCEYSVPPTANAEIVDLLKRIVELLEQDKEP